MRQSMQSQMGRSNVGIRGTAMIALAVALVSGPLGNVATAAYQTLEQKLSTRDTYRLNSAVRRVLADPASFQNQGDLQEFNAYFNEYLFPAMTQTSAKALGEIGQLRTKKLIGSLWRAKHQGVHRHLTQMAFTNMKKVATENFHPVARFNAVVVLGLLDRQPANGDVKPVPLPEAADVLLDLLELEAAKTPDSVKVGALQGMARHVKFGLSADRSARLSAAALALLTADRPVDRSRDGHAWIQWLSAVTLAQQGKLGDGLRVHQAIMKMIGDSDRPIDSRCRVADALKDLKAQYTAAAGVDGASTIASIATLVIDVTKAEAEEAEKYIDIQRGGGSGLNSDFSIEYPRRRLLHRVQSLLTALDSVDGVLSGEAKPHVDGIRTGLDAIHTLASDKRALDIKLSRQTDEKIAPQIIEAAENLLPKDPNDDKPEDDLGDLADDVTDEP